MIDEIKYFFKIKERPEVKTVSKKQAMTDSSRAKAVKKERAVAIRQQIAMRNRNNH